MNKTDNKVSLKNISQEELRKWQLGLLDILVYFKDFCVSHNLKFYLAGGTRLGAIRHHGFIPWDDDVDVQMLREDYDKLIELWDKEADTSKYKCQVTNKDICARFPMATIRSVNTTCIYDHSVNDDICHGLKIDVEFLDVLPKRKISLVFHNLCCQIFALFRTQRLPARAPSYKKFVSRVLLWMFPSFKTRWRISRWCEKQMTKFNPGDDTDTVSYLTVAKYKKSWFNSTEWVDFEGHKMPVPVGYDQILRAQYGDYMQLPPEDKRTPVTENLIFYDVDHSYLDYKGIYYCLEEKDV